jgi:hypothetical protein
VAQAEEHPVAVKNDGQSGYRLVKLSILKRQGDDPLLVIKRAHRRRKQCGRLSGRPFAGVSKRSGLSQGAT